MKRKRQDGEEERQKKRANQCLQNKRTAGKVEKSEVGNAREDLLKSGIAVLKKVQVHAETSKFRKLVISENIMHHLSSCRNR